MSAGISCSWRGDPHRCKSVKFDWEFTVDTFARLA